MRSLVERMARAIYESHKLKKPWNHPDTKRIWHPVCRREARAALAVVIDEIGPTIDELAE